MAACRVGKPQWGERGPQNAGGYNSSLSAAPFFKEGDENFLSDYGHFFLVRINERMFFRTHEIQSVIRSLHSRKLFVGMV